MRISTLNGKSERFFNIFFSLKHYLSYVCRMQDILIIQLYIDANLQPCYTLTYILIYAIYFCNLNDAINSAYPLAQYGLSFLLNWFQSCNSKDK